MPRPSMYGSQWTAKDVLELQHHVEQDFGVRIIVSQAVVPHKDDIRFRIVAIATLGPDSASTKVISQSTTHWPSDAHKTLGGAMAWALYRIWTDCDASEEVAAARTVLDGSEQA